jgi:hypothetical protein
MENKTSKYLKYAIGEVILVVIGILIALQINNWNEERMNHETAMYLLSSLNGDLENDIEELKSNVIDAKNTVMASKILQLYALDSIKYSNDIQQFISSVASGVSFDLNNITYNEMINSGTIDLLNREIRKAVTTHYWYIESFDGNRDDLLQLKRSINQLLIENGCTPNMINENDLRNALNDKKLLAAIKQWEYLGNKQIEIHEQFLKMTKELISKIEMKN